MSICNNLIGTFNGNTNASASDRSTKVTNIFDSPVNTKYIIVEAIAFEGHPTMRLDVMGPGPGQDVTYRIQEGTAIDLNGTDLVAGTFNTGDLNGKNLLIDNNGDLNKLNGSDYGKDYSVLFYSPTDFEASLYYKVQGSVEEEPAPEPFPPPKTSVFSISFNFM